MAIPTFFAAGAGVTSTGGTPAPAYPASVAANDIAICLFYNRATTDVSASLAFPGDWNRVDDLFQSPAVNMAWAWKRLDGSETGTISLSGGTGGGVVSAARIYVFRGCVASGTPYESNTQTSADTDTIASSAINTLGTDRLAICLGGISDDNTVNTLTGSNVTWVEPVAEFTTTVGLDCCLASWTADVAAQTTPVTAGSYTMVAVDEWGTFTFALKPASTAFTLSADPGSYAVTGAAATLLEGRVLSANPGSYAVTGAAAILVFGRTLSADPGAYAVTGTAATLLSGRVLSANSGSYAVTGADAALLEGRLLSADPGAYLVTGADAALAYGRTLSADPGAYAVTGADATLVTARVLSLDAGVYAVTGQDAALLAGKVLSADPGAYVITGANADLAFGGVGAFVLSADPGSYAVSGADASLTVGYLLAADTGVYQISGANAELLTARLLAALPGSYLITGANATLTAGIPFTGPGTVIGGDTTLVHVAGGTEGRSRALGGDRTTAYASSGDRRSDP